MGHRSASSRARGNASGTLAGKPGVLVAAGALLCLTLTCSSPVWPDEATDPHAAHRAVMGHGSADPSYRVAHAEYEVPDVSLVDEQGRPVRLHQLFSGERAVVVNFIFTSCTTICPVMTATFLQLQQELASDPRRPLFVSISIDPEFDSAATLNAYAARFGADWTFLTGGRADVLAVLQSFAAWRGNKTNHAALTLFKPADSSHWTRVEGLVSARQLAEIWRAAGT